MSMKRLTLLLVGLSLLWLATFSLFFYLPPKFESQAWNADLLQRSVPLGDYQDGGFFSEPSRLAVDLESGRLVREPKAYYVVGESAGPLNYEQYRLGPNEVRHPGEWKRYKHWRKPVEIGEKPLIFRFPCTPRSAGIRYAVGLTWDGKQNEFHWLDLDASIPVVRSALVGGYQARITLGFSDPGRVVIAMTDYQDGPWQSRLYAIDHEKLEQLAEWNHSTQITHWNPSYVVDRGQAYVACQEDTSGELVLRFAEDGRVAKRIRVVSEDLMRPSSQLTALENGLVSFVDPSGGLAFFDCFREAVADQSRLGAGELPSLVYDVGLSKAFRAVSSPNKKAILVRYEDGQLTPVSTVNSYPLILPPDEYLILSDQWGASVEVYSATDGSMNRRFLPHVLPVCGSLVLVLGWVIMAYCWTLVFLSPFRGGPPAWPPKWVFLAGLSAIPIVVYSLGEAYSSVWVDDGTLGESIMIGVAVGAISLALVHLFFGSFRFSTRTIVFATVVTTAVLVLTRSYEFDGGGFAWIGLAIAPFFVVMVCIWLARIVFVQGLAQRNVQHLANPDAEDESDRNEIASRLSLWDLLLITGSIAMLVAILTPWLGDVRLQVPLGSFWICGGVFTAAAIAVLLAGRKPACNRAARYTLISIVTISCCVVIASCYASFFVPNLKSTVQFTVLYSLAFSTGSLTFAWGHLWFSVPRRAIKSATPAIASES
ncbi:MAG: hypothetical protein ACE361_10380 [Aureliella sp.]